MLVVSSALVVTPAVLTSEAAAAQTGRSPETRPAALWNAFPLRVTPTRASVRPAVRPRVPDAVVALPSPAAPAVVRREAPSGIGTYTILVIALFLGCAGLAAYFVLRGPAGRWSQAMGAAGSHAFATTPRLVSVLSPRRATEQGYLLHLPGRMGFGDRVVERTGPAPVPGEVIVDDELGDPGQTYVVQIVRRSPIPGDRRPCAELRIV